jgi:hypothetical protein
VYEALQVRLPDADVEVEILLPIALCGYLLRLCSGADWILLGPSGKRLQEDSHAAQERVDPGVPGYVHRCSLEGMKNLNAKSQGGCGILSVPAPLVF